jgi:hypothetical protein
VGGQWNGCTVSDSYSTGSVSGNDHVGGLVGANGISTISNSYSTGSVSGNTWTGGLVGENGGTVSNSFWDTQTSGQGTSSGGTGKNTTEMMDFDTFSDAGWDIVAVANSGARNTSYIWNIVDDVTYPFLTGQQEFNHGLGYLVVGGSQYIGEDVTLEDRFGSFEATVTYPYVFANPVEKRHDGTVAPILYPDATYLSDNITLEEEPGEWLVVVKNQFGIQELTVSGPVALSVPAQELEPFYHDPPAADHLLSYHAIAGDPVNEVVDLYDEFGSYTDVLVTQPMGISNPVRKTHDGEVTEILYADADFCTVNYLLSLEYSPAGQVQVTDQFGEQILDVYGPIVLAVPSRILSYQRIS